METKFVSDNGVLTAVLSGRLDSSTVRGLETELKERLVGVGELVFDLADLEYISSAGIRVLLASHKLLVGKMTVLHANGMIREIFDMTGMSAVLNIEEDL